MQLDVIETNGLALGQILGNIIDSLDIGRSIQAVEGGGKPVIAPSSTLSSLKESSSAGGPKAPSMGKNPTSPGSPAPAPAQPELTDFGLILEDVVLDGMNLEHRMRSLVGQDGIDKVEVILEVLPRSRGGWMVKDAPGPLLRFVLVDYIIRLVANHQRIRQDFTELFQVNRLGVYPHYCPRRLAHSGPACRLRQQYAVSNRQYRHQGYRAWW